MLRLAVLIFALSLLPQFAHAQPCDDDLACGINEARIAAGLAPFAGSDELALAAQWHANDIAARNLLTHESADGADPWDRAEDAGYPVKDVSEVIAWTEGTPAHVVRGFLDSPRHGAILMDAHYRAMGVGMAESNGKRWYVVDLGPRR